MARRDLRTAAAPVDLIQPLGEGQLQLGGIPGMRDLLGALLPPHYLQAEAVEAQCARRL
jgi:hypothetical protein